MAEEPDELFAAIGAPKWHGQSPDALIDSMIWGGINAVGPPYMIRISGIATAPEPVREEVEVVKNVIAEARLDYRQRRGGDAAVSIEISP